MTRPKKPRPRLVPLLLTLGAALAFSAAAGVAQQAPSTIGVDEIRPGMRGYGLSVLRGTAPERFDVEVIDVLHNFRPDQDLILVRTPHPLLNRSRAVGGMSGSPVYIDGRLAGAYAYGWPYGTDPIVGVTPIRNMLTEMTRPVRQDAFPGSTLLPQATGRARRRQPSRTARRADYRPNLDATAFTGIRAAAERMRAANQGPVGLRAAQTPVMLGGFTDEVARTLGRELGAFGLEPVQAGGSGGAAADPAPRFVDGGAIGVQLIRGDISATGVGTVTHVGPNGRVIAFGHPMMNAGQIGLPTATARVLHVLVSEARSFKIAEALAPLGTLVHDRQSAIVIDTNRRAATIPVRVRLHGVEGAPRTEWNVEIAYHKQLSPLLTLSALVNSLKATAADRTDVVYRARTRLLLEDRAPIEFEDLGFMDAGPADAARLSSLRLFPAMLASFDNPFGPERVRGVEIDVSLEYRRDVLQLVDASVTEDEVDPGSEVPVYLTMRRYGHPDTTRVIRVRVPESAGGQTIELAVGPGPANPPERGRARSMDDVFRALGQAYPATSLVASLKLPTRGLRFGGHAVSALPGSALDALQLAHGTAPGRPFETRVRQEIPVGDVVFGNARLNLRVRRAPRDGASE